MRKLRKHRPKATGFTLVELLVVIAIIGVLIALLLPAVQAAREAARRTQCQNNLKQIGLGIQNHHDTLRQFPPGHRFTTSCANSYAVGSWVVWTLPFMEQQNLRDLYSSTNPWWNGANEAARDVEVETLVCPSDVSVANFNSATNFGFRGNYAANTGIGTYSRSLCTTPAHQTGLSVKGPFVFNSKTRFADLTDGSSNTLGIAEIRRVNANDSRGALFADAGSNLYTHDFTPNPTSSDATERCVSQVAQGLPCTSNGSGGPHRLSVRSLHPTGAQGLLLDGSVRFISETIDLNTWQALGTMNGGEVLGEF